MSNRPSYRLVVATSNLGKLKEISEILKALPLELCRPIEVLGYAPEVTEDADTFVANACLKAQAIARLTQCYALADDSGLEVDALGGAPGVRSARYASEHATDADNNRALLEALARCGHPESAARFRCAMALAAPDGTILETTEGTCEGRVRSVARGTLGFGYDPLFVVTELGERAMAELEPEEKNAVSHRGRALARMATVLARLTEAP